MRHFWLRCLLRTLNPPDIRRILTQEYEDSEDFNMLVEDSVYEAMNRIRLEQMFETDGAYNPDKIVDIMDYSRNWVITGNNHSGVAYTLDELKDWSEDFYAGEGQLYDENSVIVCEQPDGSYYYYYLDDFLMLFDRGELRIEFDDSGDYQMTQKEYLQELEDGTLTVSGFYRMRITNRAGKTLYTDCWNFGESLREKYPPVGAASLLQVVNETPQLNGKLSIIYDNIATALSSLYDNEIQVYESGWEYLEEGNTNLTYIYANEETKKVVTNKEAYSSYDDLKKNIQEMKSGDSVRYMIIQPKLKDFETNMNISESGEWDMVRSYETDRKMESVVAVAIDTSYPVNDQFYEGHMYYGENVPFLKAALRSIFVFGILLVVSVVWTAMTAGRRPEDNKVHLTAFDDPKTEIAAALIIGIWLGVNILLMGAGRRICREIRRKKSAMVVMNLPEEPAVIRVDGRRMWRVLENIFNNAVKYAMSGTRVYADLRVGEEKVEFSLKNVSEQQLNISADELTERFIRGDLSEVQREAVWGCPLPNLIECRAEHLICIWTETCSG